MAANAWSSHMPWLLGVSGTLDSTRRHRGSTQRKRRSGYAVGLGGLVLVGHTHQPFCDWVSTEVPATHREHPTAGTVLYDEGRPEKRGPQHCGRDTSWPSRGLSDDRSGLEQLHRRSG